MIFLAVRFLGSSCFLSETLYKATADLPSALLSGDYQRDNFTALGANSVNLKYLNSLILNVPTECYQK